MPTKCEIIHDAVKSHLTAFWIILSVSSVGVRGQEGKKENSVHSCKVFKKSRPAASINPNSLFFPLYRLNY